MIEISNAPPVAPSIERSSAPAKHAQTSIQPEKLQVRTLADKFAALQPPSQRAPSPTLAVVGALQDPLKQPRAVKLQDLSPKQQRVLLSTLRSSTIREFHRLADAIALGVLPPRFKLPKLLQGVDENDALIEVVLHPTSAEGSYGKVQRGRRVDTTQGMLKERVAAKVFRGEERFARDVAKLDARMLKEVPSRFTRGALGMDHALVKRLIKCGQLTRTVAAQVSDVGGRSHVPKLVAEGVIDAQTGMELMFNRSGIGKYSRRVQKRLKLSPFVSLESIEQETAMAAEAGSPLAEQDRISVNGRTYSLMRLMDGEAFEVVTAETASEELKHSSEQLQGLSEYMALQISAALAPKDNLAHCDLKLENIWFDRAGAVLLGDWGLARRAGADPKIHGVNGTPGYMAPETLDQEPYTSGVDVYGLGMAVAIAATCKLPFADASTEGRILATRSLNTLRAEMREDAQGRVTVADLEKERQGASRRNIRFSARESTRKLCDFFLDWASTHHEVATFVLSKMLCALDRRATMREVHAFFAQREAVNPARFEQARQSFAAAYEDPANVKQREADALVDAFAAAYVSPAA